MTFDATSAASISPRPCSIARSARPPDDSHYLRTIDALCCNGWEPCEEEAHEARPSRSSTGMRRGRRLKS
jgi:hypothetical protein